MDHPIWEASSPPPEDWQTEDVDREWQHNGIVSEEVDAFGIKQYVTSLNLCSHGPISDPVRQL